MAANRITIGETREAMRAMPAGSVQCVVTSPPYWGLRDYGIPGSDWADGWHGVYGLEPTPEMFIAHSVEVFGDVKRILRDDGVLFLNLGDSYAQDTKWGGQTGGKHAKGLHGTTMIGRNRNQTGLKPGDLCNIPHRVAAALQADGWFWRSTIIWAKRSPMPESISGWRWVRCRVKAGRETTNGGLSSWDMGEHSHGPASGEYRGSEKTTAKWSPCPGCSKCEPNGGLILRRGKWRPTTAHEYIFMFSKSEKYFSDGDAVQELTTGNAHSRGDGLNPKCVNGSIGVEKQNSSFSAATNGLVETRNPRSVWTLSSEPYKEAHFATFPTMLAKKCIEAGTSAGGCCPACEAPYAPVVESERVATRPGSANKIWKHADGDHIGQRSQDAPNLDPKRHIAVTRITGYLPTCQCKVFGSCDEEQFDCTGCTGEGRGECGAKMIVPAPVGCLVFDPFGGSGTTAQVAKHLGRRWLMTEVNPEYAALAAKRIETPPKWKDPKPVKKRRKKCVRQGVLFSD